MGNTQPTNKTGQQQTQQKLDNAKKLGVLSLTEHKLTEIPSEIYSNTEIVAKLRVLDLSKNQLTGPITLSPLKSLKTLQLDHNVLTAGSLDKNLSTLTNLQNLSLSNNLFGKIQPTTVSSQSTSTERKKIGGLAGIKIPKNQSAQTTTTSSTAALAEKMQKQLVVSSPNSILPELPISLKQCNLSANYLSCIPASILSKKLVKLEKLDLSKNQLATIPDEISNLSNLEELKLDDNTIISIPSSIGMVTKLKVLSLKNNRLTYTSKQQQQQQQEQPLPKSLFTDTKLIDLNLHGNTGLTNTQLNEFDGFQQFLDRRQKVKSKLLSDLDTCGLD